MHRSITPLSRSVLVAAGLALSAVTLAACSGGSSSGASTQQTSAAAGSSNAAPPAGAGANAPAASGLIADVSGSTMQVQSQQTGQVAVSWSTATSFTDTVSTTASAIKAGDCVFATGPSGSSPTATTFTAATVSVTPAVNGACGAPGGGGGGGLGARPGGGSGFPGGGGARPSGAPGGGAGTARANGSVKSVSGSTIVITSQAGGSTPTARTVTIGGSTKITTVATATASAVKVGKCATVQGTAGSTGTVTAKTVRITDPTNGQCGGRFGAGANGG
jgi:hypothetical protein